MALGISPSTQSINNHSTHSTAQVIAPVSMIVPHTAQQITATLEEHALDLLYLRYQYLNNYGDAKLS